MGQLKTWIVSATSDDPDILAYTLYEIAQGESVSVDVTIDGQTLVVESASKVYRVEAVLDELGEPYAREE